MLCSTAFFLQQSSRQIYYQFINNVKCLYWDQTSFGVHKHMFAILIHSVFCTTGKSWICFFLPWIFQIRNLHSHWCAKSCLSFVFGSSVCSHLSFPWGFSCMPKKVHGGFLPCSEFDTKNCTKIISMIFSHQKITICLAYILQKRQGFRVDDAKDSRLGSFN